MDDQTPTKEVSGGQHPREIATGGQASLRGRLARNKAPLMSSLVLLVIVTAVIFAPLIAPYDPAAQNLSDRFAAYSRAHLLGTDELGRDVFSRMLYGGAVTLLASLQGVIVSVLIGGPLGFAAGYFRGPFDSVVSRTMDILISIPAIILALTVVAVIGNNVTIALVTMGVAVSPRFYRIARAVAMSLSSQTYVEASRTIGCSHTRIIFKHIIPNGLSPLIVQASILFSLMILAEATLSFVGIGVSPPQASWGSMLRIAASSMYQYPSAIWATGVPIIVTVWALSSVANWLRDAQTEDVPVGKAGVRS